MFVIDLRNTLRQDVAERDSTVIGSAFSLAFTQAVAGSSDQNGHIPDSMVPAVIVRFWGLYDYHAIRVAATC